MFWLLGVPSSLAEGRAKTRTPRMPPGPGLNSAGRWRCGHGFGFGLQLAECGLGISAGDELMVWRLGSLVALVGSMLERVGHARDIPPRI